MTSAVGENFNTLTHFCVPIKVIKFNVVFQRAKETCLVPPSITIKEACMGVLRIQDICHFTSRDIGYYPFYFQGYVILC